MMHRHATGRKRGPFTDATGRCARWGLRGLYGHIGEGSYKLLSVAPNEAHTHGRRERIT
jgi:hypothetical protein